MFEIESNDNFIDHIWNDDQCYSITTDPIAVKFIDNVISPHQNIGNTSGAFILASYYEVLSFQNSDPIKLSDDEIISEIYDNISIKGLYGHITLSNGMNRLKDMLNQSLSVSKYNVFYTLYSYNLKQLLHKYSFAMIELKSNSAYCSQDNTTFNGKYKIESNGVLLDEYLSKGFVCVGYDDFGVILLNSLGLSFGNSGFIKLKWDIIHSNFIKASVISII